jgi:hypothetical protein
MQRIESEAISAVGYESATQTLRITYRNGRTYDYADVPPEEFSEFMNAPSRGAYANQVIKPKYKYREISTTASDD